MTDTLHKDLFVLMIQPRWILQKHKCSRQSCKDKQNTCFFQYHFPENRVLYEIMWKNMVESARTQMAI